MPFQSFRGILFQLDDVLVSPRNATWSNYVLEHFGLPVVGDNMALLKLRKYLWRVGIIREDAPNHFWFSLDLLLNDAERFTVHDFLGHLLSVAINCFCERRDR